jgi:hypothetical protein
MDAEKYLDAASAAVGLTVSAEHRPGVLRYLQLVASLAPRVTEFELGLADEGAAVFKPVSPPGPGAKA